MFVFKDTIQSKTFIHNMYCHPHEQHFLTRPHMIKKIHEILIHQNHPIKTIIIHGIGGVGKTTLARQYTKQYRPSMVWEINAETPETITASFFELSNQCVQTQEEKDILLYIKSINNQKERHIRILQFVKNKLKSYKNWLLIYDNVESLKHLPSHEYWGNGQIIITTRKMNLKSTHHKISVDPLSDEEMYALFTKVLPIGPYQKKNTLIILQKLPPFPFDVAAISYHIKSTQTSYLELVDQLKKYDPNFKTMLLKTHPSFKEYFHTRYNILKLKFKSILKGHPEFKELLFALALFDSQRIPKAFLEYYKKSTVVDLFILTLKENSLITMHEQEAISLHRSTQEHLVRFLTEELKDIQKYIDLFTNVVKEYLEKPIQNIDTSGLQLFVPHLLAFSKHEKLFTFQSQLILKLLFGQIYFSLGDYPKSKEYLDSAFKIMVLNKTSVHLKAELLSYLGSLYKNLSDYEKAKKYFTEAESLYKNNNDLDKAFLLVNFGHCHMFLGDYQTAKKLMNEGIDIYRLENNYPRLAMGYVYLGNVYEWEVNYSLTEVNYKLAHNICNKIYGPMHTTAIRAQLQLGRIFNSLGKYDVAIKLMEKNAYIYEKHLSHEKERQAFNLINLGAAYLNLGMNHLAQENITQGYQIHVARKNALHIAWSNVYLAQVELNNQQYQKAIVLLEDSYNTHKLTYPDENQIKWFSWIYHYLGNAYKLSGQYEKTKNAYEKSLRIGQKHYGENHVDTAAIMADFGDFYRCIHEYEKAEKMFNAAIAIFEKNNHPQVYKCLEYLGDLRIAQSKPKEALNYYKKALDIAKTNFPKSSDHTKRLQQKLSTSS